MAAAQDVHVRICNQEIVKFDLEVKALIQDIRDCSGPLSALTELNAKVKEKFQQLRHRIQQSDVLEESEPYLQNRHRQPREGRASPGRRPLEAKENRQREPGADVQHHHREPHGDQPGDVPAGAAERGSHADAGHLFPDYPGRQRRIQVHVGDHPAGTEAHHKIQSPRADGQAAHFPGPGPVSRYGSLHCKKAAFSIFIRAKSCQRLPFQPWCQDPARLPSSGPAASRPTSPGVQVLSRTDGVAPPRFLQVAAL
ncbi:vesicle transport protein SEC20 isoform X1 [Myotis yumanensis]|uniref:vesicle transport protein SEC20 isoform X1 n=1 Tax=Myotis yumanensis TaxID=159337 RepID=UPI0038D2007F